jgi:hypothetical protein
LLTLRTCCSAGKPHLVIDLADKGKLTAAVQAARAWIATHLPHGVLNVSGPRACKHPRVCDRARLFLRALLGTGAG